MNQSIEKKGRKRSTSNQLEILLKYMEGHTLFARAGLIGAAGCIKQQQMWDELSSQLNACGDGPSKNVTLWQKTWTSLKSNVKTKAAKFSVHAKGTGGGLPLKPLTVFEERVLAVSGPESVIGDESLQEAGCSKRAPSSNEKEVPQAEAAILHPNVLHPANLTTDVLQPIPPSQQILNFTEANAIIQPVLPAVPGKTTAAVKRRAADGAADIKAYYMKGQERRCDIEEKRLRLDEDTLKLEQEKFELEKEKFKFEREKFDYQKGFFVNMCSQIMDSATRLTNALINVLNK